MKCRARNSTRSFVGSLAIAGVLALACANVQEIEEQDGGAPAADPDFQNPAAAEGQLELDNQLCWEQSNRAETTPEAIQKAHADCMERMGWTRP